MRNFENNFGDQTGGGNTGWESLGDGEFERSRERAERRYEKMLGSEAMASMRKKVMAWAAAAVLAVCEREELMKKLMFLILAVMLLTGCGQAKEAEQEAVYMNITAQEAKAVMDSREDYIILDVREQEEYDESHIPGAILIPYGQIPEKAEQLLQDKDQLLLVYCRSGRRSKIAAESWWSWVIPTSWSSAASSTGLMKWKSAECIMKNTPGIGSWGVLCIGGITDRMARCPLVQAARLVCICAKRR